MNPLHGPQPRSPRPPVTICVLTFGRHARLARQTLESIRRFGTRPLYRLRVGANAPCRETLEYLRELNEAGEIERLEVSETNLNKCPMMRRLFTDLETEFVWWFDDDSYITEPRALERWIEFARDSDPDVALWGKAAVVGAPPDQFRDTREAWRFVRSAKWYRGLTPPSIDPGGKGEFNFRWQGTGDPRWSFILGGCWMMRSSAIRALNWPDPRLVKNGDDVLLGEALRQYAWRMADNGTPGVRIDTEARRGDPGKRILPTSEDPPPPDLSGATAPRQRERLYPSPMGPEVE